MSELIDEMLRYIQDLGLRNREKVLQRAAGIYDFYTNNFPERKMKRSAMLSSCLYISAMLHGERVTQAS